MSYAAIADRYARALLELGAESNQLTQLSDQICRVADAYRGSRELQAALDNPMVPDASRDALLKELTSRLGASPTATNAVRLLASRRRLRALPEIATALTRLADEKAGVVRATVTSAKPLADSYYRELVAELEKRTKRKVVLHKEQDPSLISGFVARIGDNTIDGSLRGRLDAIERQLAANT